MAEGFFFGDQVASPSRRRLYEVLMSQGLSSEPIQHWTQGAANMAKAILGAHQLSRQDAAEREATAGLLAAFGGGQSAGAGTGGGASSAPSASATSASGDASDIPNLPPTLISSESGGNLRAQNSAMGAGGQRGHFGELQFGQARLQEAGEAGAIPRGTTPQQFMGSPDLQRAAARWHFDDIDSRIRSSRLDRFIGQSVNGIPVTIDGMRAVAHLGGSGGLQQFLETGGRYNPADANGTRLSDYLRRHASNRTFGPAQAVGIPQPPSSADRSAAADAQWNNRPRIDYSRPQQRADIGSAVTDELSLTQPTALTSMQPEPVDAAWEERLRIAAEQDAQARPLPPSRPAAAPAIMDRPDALGGITPGAPTAAPIPAPRPVQIAQGAPIPQARPNIEPPAGAQPAIARPDLARALMPERDRLMLMRDEASLAPGEADTLRAGLPGSRGAHATPAASQNSPAVTGNGFDPLGGLRNLLMGGAQRVPAGQAPPVAAMGTAGAPASPAQPASGDQRQRLMMALMNPSLSASGRQMGMAMLQQLQPDMQIVTTPEGAIIAVNKRTGAVQNLRDAARPPVILPEGGTLVNPQDGRVLARGGAQQTPDQRNYDTYVRQEQQAGRTPDDFTKWMRGNRRESSGLDTPDEAFQKELGKNLGTQIGALIEDGRQAGVDLRNIAELETLMGQIGTGATAEAKRRLGELGITFEGTDRIQAVNALLSRLTPQQRVPGSGATSDFDAKMFRDSLPRLINSPNGNRLIMDTMRQIAENRLARSDIATRMSIPVSDGGLSRSDGLKQLQELSRQAREISTRVGEAAGLTGRNGAAGAAGGAPAVVPPQGAIDVLRGNPSPTARRQFDEVFGPGAADRTLRGQ
ncbi:MAG: hypothetical protein LCH88_09175 [Proteobacteria bacterium]|nr:hypothetical protein [Pseudomonadota bacterium]